MLFGREQFAVKTEMGGEVIDKLYAKELVPTPIEEFEELPEDEKKIRKPYPFNQRTYEAAPGIICDQDVAVPMRDGVILYADIFRPADSTAKVPVILAWSNYCKRPNEYRPDELKAYTPGVPKGSISDLAKFEAADPEFWVPNGYAIANVDIRGIGYWADKIPRLLKGGRTRLRDSQLEPFPPARSCQRLTQDRQRAEVAARAPRVRVARFLLLHILARAQDVLRPLLQGHPQRLGVHAPRAHRGTGPLRHHCQGIVGALRNSSYHVLSFFSRTPTTCWIV